MSKHQTFILSHWNALAKFTRANQWQLPSLWNPTNIFFSFSSRASGYLINVWLKQNAQTWCKQTPDSHSKSVISSLSLKSQPELNWRWLSSACIRGSCSQFLTCYVNGLTHTAVKSAFSWASQHFFELSLSYTCLPAACIHSLGKEAWKFNPKYIQLDSGARAMHFPYPSSCPSWHDQFISPLPFSVGWSKAAGVKPSGLMRRGAVIFSVFTCTLNNY